MIDLRFARNEDLEEVIACDIQLQYLSIDRLKNKISQNEIIIATLDNKIVGVIGVEYIWTTRPYIDTLFVDPEVRRQKIGSKLLDFLENHLKSEGYQYLYSSAEE